MKSSRFREVCGQCAKPAKFNCPICHIPYYCSKECQKDHTSHVRICNPQTIEKAQEHISNMDDLIFGSGL